MTNEELTVLDGLATELIERRGQLDIVRARRDEIVAEHGKRVNENKRLLDECNRLRESEANALNAEREAVCDRDDAREKLGEWVRFMNDTIYSALVSAIERKDCRKIVKDAVSAMHKFSEEHPVVVMEGGMAK